MFLGVFKSLNEGHMEPGENEEGRQNHTLKKITYCLYVYRPICKIDLHTEKANSFYLDKKNLFFVICTHQMIGLFFLKLYGVYVLRRPRKFPKEKKKLILCFYIRFENTYFPPARLVRMCSGDLWSS